MFARSVPGDRGRGLRDGKRGLCRRLDVVGMPGKVATTVYVPTAVGGPASGGPPPCSPHSRSETGLTPSRLEAARRAAAVPTGHRRRGSERRAV